MVRARLFWITFIAVMLGWTAYAQVVGGGGSLSWPGTAAVSNYGTAPTGTVPAVNAYVTNAGSGGTADADNTAWTAGTTQFTPAGCEYTSGGATAITTAHIGTAGCTTGRALFTDKSSVAGVALSAAVSAYGTPPTGTEVEGLNAYVTNSVAVTGTFYQTTQPVSAASLPLPTGAALETGGNLATTATNTGTIAGAVTSSVMQGNLKQVNGIATLTGAGATGTGSQRETVAQDTTTIAGSAPGTAGTASANVVTVQGVASMTALLANPGTAANWGVLAQAASTSGQLGELMMGAATTSAPSYTSGQTDPISLDLAGNVRVNCITGCSGSGGTSSSFSATFPSTGTAAGAEYLSSAPTLTSGQMVALQTTVAGSLHTTVDTVSAGAYVSGSVLSGAYASGSLASGAVVDITNMSASTGSAPPSKGIYLGANASGATGGQMRGLINCDNHIFKHITTATDTLAVQGVASQTIYVCGWRSRAAGVATWYLENTASTNANCSSTLTQITGVATEAANTGEVNNNPLWGGLKNTSANGLCINSTGTGGVDVDIWYTQL